MKKNSNAEYIFKATNDIPIHSWIYEIQEFFGKEKSEEFFEYFINHQNILRTNDIRNSIITGPMSVYNAKNNNEQLAFISTYYKLIGEQIDIGYRKLSKQLKQLGYSYSIAWYNYYTNKKDTYQKEPIFIIYSETDTQEEFKTKIVELAKSNNINSVLITDPLTSDEAKLKITSKLFDVTGKVVQGYKDTTIETVEQYLSDLTGTKVLYKIPYEKYKVVLCFDDKLDDYYSPSKQEKVKHTKAKSFSSGLLKQALINKFNNENYNN